MADRGPNPSPKNDLADTLLRRGRTTYLLCGLLFLLVSYPYLQKLPWGELVEACLWVIILVAGIYSVSRSRQTVALLLVFALPALAAYSYNFFSVQPSFLSKAAYDTFASLFFAAVFLNLFGYVLRRGPVTAEKLHGAASGYILIALLWVHLYSLVEHFVPGSFAISETHNPDRVLDTYDFLYESFTTLTTTGYGDMIAVTSEARSLAILQQTVGVFYVAVIIARLAGVYPPEARSEPTNDAE